LVKALDNPNDRRGLYRFLDRVVLSGDQTWEIGWRPLAQALGLSTNYSRPAEFRKVLIPHLDRLIAKQIIDSYDYKRGGKFIFHLRNYLRSELRRVLQQLSVYEEAARQLVAGHDEVVIMCQCDQLHHGSHPRPEKPGGWLTNAIREAYDLRYPPDEPETVLRNLEHAERGRADRVPQGRPETLRGGGGLVCDPAGSHSLAAGVAVGGAVHGQPQPGARAGMTPELVALGRHGATRAHHP